MNFLEILIDELQQLWILIFISVFFVVVAIRTIIKKNKISTLSKIKNFKTLKEDENDYFGIKELKNEEKFKEEVNILENMLDGNKTIEVPFTKAIYLLKNYSRYNLFSSEDGKIIFQHLKNITDNEQEIEIIDNNQKTIEEPISNKIVFNKSDETYKIQNELGYTIIQDGKILESVVFSEEEEKKKNINTDESSLVDKKITELENKLNSHDEILLNKTQKIEKDISDEIDEKEKIYEDESKGLKEKELTKDIANLFDSLSINESKEEPKERNDLSEINKNEGIERTKLRLELVSNNLELLPEDKNIVFLLEDFDNKFENRAELLIRSLLNTSNLLKIESSLIFVDIDLANKKLFVDVYVFIILFSNFFKNEETIQNILLQTNESIDLNNLRKVLQKLNEILNIKNNKDFFLFTGKLKSPFVQRNIKYEIKEKKILSMQMLVINLESEIDFFKELLNVIKKEILSEYKPETKKIKVTDSIDNVESIDRNFFS